MCFKVLLSYKMRKNKFLPVIVLTLVFHTLFWNKQFGLNVLIYIGILHTMLNYKDSNAFKNARYKTTLLLTVFGGLLMITHNSTTALYFTLCSHFLSIGFHFQPKLETIWASLLTGIANHFKSFRSISKMNNDSKQFQRTIKRMPILFKIILLPTFVLCIFYALYRWANPKYNEIALQ